MAAHCPIDFDIVELRAHVASVYSEVAHNPHGEFHFHRGAKYAVERLGYDPVELLEIPERAKERFAGVGNPLSVGPIPRGATVLDHACGAGMDLLIAARRAGPTGRAIGIDSTPAMREVAAVAVREANMADRVEIRAGWFEELPVEDASVDVILSNGVLNLSPDKRQVLREAFRVLRPGGRLYLADVVVQRELTLTARKDPELWAACIGGALVEHELVSLSTEVGFERCVIGQRFESFADTSAEAKLSRDLAVGAVNFSAHKPI